MPRGRLPKERYKYVAPAVDVAGASKAGGSDTSCQAADALARADRPRSQRGWSRFTPVGEPRSQRGRRPGRAVIGSG